MSSKKSPISTAQRCQRTNWEGSLPITLSLAPTSLSSPTMPPSLHRMVPRQTYLHTGLEEDVRLLYKFAPSANFRPSLSSMSTDHWNADTDNDDRTSSPSPSGEDTPAAATDETKDTSNDANGNANTNGGDETGAETENDRRNQSTTDGTTTGPYPICWFEDEETEAPIRWHLFVGVLYDLLRLHRCLSSSAGGDDRACYPMDRTLPWKIRVHFTSYPASLLPLQRDGCDRSGHPNADLPLSATSMRNKKFVDDGLLKTLSKTYINSLKTALYVQHNSNRVSRRCMTKDSDLDLWNSIVRNNWGLYHKICHGFDGEAAAAAENQEDGCNGDGDTDARDLHNVPIRILVDGNPAMTRACPPYREVVVGKDEGEVVDDQKYGGVPPQKKKMMTLGEVLMEWLPHLFTGGGGEMKENESHFVGDCRWCIQGLQVPWDSPIASLWRGLSHPDRFLYIIIITRDDSI